MYSLIYFVYFHLNYTVGALRFHTVYNLALQITEVPSW